MLEAIDEKLKAHRIFSVAYFLFLLMSGNIVAGAIADYLLQCCCQQARTQCGLRNSVQWYNFATTFVVTVLSFLFAINNLN